MKGVRGREGRSSGIDEGEAERESSTLSLAQLMISLSVIGLLVPERDWRMDRMCALISCHTKPNQQH